MSRAQILEAGGADSDIARMLRRRELARLHPGVYVDHTGPPSWLQRAWGAVLLTQPSALGGRSSLRAHGLRGHDSSPEIEVVVGRHRHLVVPDGITLVRMAGFEDAAQRHLSPPRLRLEVALLQVAGRATSDDRAVAVLADACQERRTTAARLMDELRGMAKAPRRKVLVEILGDVAVGACSVLERRYLRDVERAHGLPRGGRQRPSQGSVRDVEYVQQATLVELDGRLGHEWTADRWRDLDRDVDSAVDGLLTIRVGWRQVLDPCHLAERVGQIFVARGWQGAALACGPTCAVRG